MYKQQLVERAGVAFPLATLCAHAEPAVAQQLDNRRRAELVQLAKQFLGSERGGEGHQAAVHLQLQRLVGQQTDRIQSQYEHCDHLRLNRAGITQAAGGSEQTDPHLQERQPLPRGLDRPPGQSRVRVQNIAGLGLTQQLRKV